MSTWNPVGAYRPGSSLLHRLRPGAKLLGLFAFAIAIVWVRGTLSTAVALAIALALALIAGMRTGDLLRVARGFAIVAVLLFVFTAVSSAAAVNPERDLLQLFPAQWWVDGWERGFEVVGDLFALILAASAFTASTAVDDMLDTIIWALGFLRPLGAKPERVALAFSLVLGAIPHLFRLAHETREAAKARGLERSPRALLVPFALRAVAHAHNVGDALHARGLGDDA